MKIFTLLLLFVSFFSTPVQADEFEVWIQNGPAQSEVHLNRHHEKSRNATVKIISQLGHGTGTYVKINGSYGILTAKHVVDTGQPHYIIQAGLHQSIATLIWSDDDADIAFLATEKIDRLSPLKMVSSSVEEGEQILYSGFPSSHQMLTFSCSVANANYNGLLATQCWAWFGSSGSGFVNRRGKVFAVLSAVSVENFYGHPQVLETLVYGAPIREHMLTQIKDALTAHVENE
tara:strand:- start:198 stop:893 length:696 start_codon:yes stop_codon:yes gene_type:complete